MYIFDNVSTPLFPDNFIKSLQSARGFVEEAFSNAHTASPSVSVRQHPIKKLGEYAYTEKVPWCENAIYLKERPVFTLDPLLHAGCYYVQEASSMFTGYALAQVCDFSNDIKVLDLCAAPGGKSTQIVSLLSANSMLVSNEIVKQRVQVLKENITKWGYNNTVVTHNEPSQFQLLQQYFDAIIVDAPCSGSGLFRKDPNAMKHWSLRNVAMCAQRQEKILDNILPTLKENGILIYSTCSYSVEENEMITDYLISKHNMTPMLIQIPEEWNIVITQSGDKGFGYRFYPDKLKGEGFYLCALRKNEHKPVTTNARTRLSQMEAISKDELYVVSKWIKDVEASDFFKINQKIMAVPKRQLSEIEKLSTTLIVLQAGIEIGEIKGKDFIPAHALALSNILPIDIPRYELDKSAAIKYLRKQEIILPGKETGFGLVCYQNIPLGWIKKLQGRINNYYPVDYRIRI